MRTFKDISGKTLQVFEMIAVNSVATYDEDILCTLLDKQYIQYYNDVLRSPGQLDVHVKQYYVPVSVHIAWCEWCAATVNEDE